MEQSIIFLDRDGVIIEEKEFLVSTSDVKLIPGSSQAIKLLKNSGYKVIVITNQPVVARGLCSSQDVENVNSYINTLIEKESGASIDAFYYCPHHPTRGENLLYTRECECRKPKPGMILQAKNDFKIEDLSKCFMIGDKIGDIKAGRDAGCKTILVETGYGGREEWDDATPDYRSKNLFQAVNEVVLKKMRLFINAGGKGKRLGNLTKDIPKPMVKINGKPVLEHLVDWAKQYDAIDSIVMMNGYKAEFIESYFGDGSSFGIPIYHSTENEPLGSGGAIRHAKRYINGPFIVISGDHICDVDIHSMIDFHKSNKSQITALVHESSHPHDSDILNIDEDNKVIKFISKRDDHTGAGILTNSGLCILEPEILDFMDEENFEFEGHVYPKVIENDFRMFAYNTDEFIADMGTPERLEKCRRFLETKNDSQKYCSNNVTKYIMSDFKNRRGDLSALLPDIERAYTCLASAFSKGGTLYICGNGGSHADALHISGELLKSFEASREMSDEDKLKFSGTEFESELTSKLEKGLPTVVLGDNVALSSAYSNDIDPNFVYAQHLFAMNPSKNDVFIGISTSGNSLNVRYAANVAKALGMSIISLTGPKPNPLENISDIPLMIPGESVADIQENSLPVYHLLCKLVEAHFFS